MTVNARAHVQLCGSAEKSTVQLVLLRHAQSQLHGRFCGHSNPALSAEGHREISDIIQRLSAMTPSMIWCSDLRRAQETASPIAEHFRVPCRASAGLREMNFGLWEGLTWEEVEMQFPEDSRGWSKSFPHHRPPGGESFREFQSRVITELERLARDAESGCVFLVTHAGFIRAAVVWVLGVPDDRISRIGQDYGAATILQKMGSHWSVTAMNAGKLASGNCVAAEDRT